MLRPAYKITISNKIVDTTDEPQASTVVDLAVSVAMDTPTDIFTLVLGQVGGLKPGLNDEAVIELGYADNGSLTQVMTGTVVTVEPGLIKNRIVGHSVVQTLLHSFADQTYESKKAGEIVRDLVDRAGVDIATAEDGINLPAYVVEGRRSIYHHMKDLADLCGFDLYVNSEGELVFKRFIGGNIVHIFEYAKHILELEILQNPPQADLVEAFGESPADSQGAEAWAWLTKDFSGSKGTAGSGTTKLLLERPVLRTAEAAQSAADAALTDIRRRALRGRLLSLGRPEVKLGDAIRLRDVPDEAFNNTFQVRGVTHRITKSSGFTTMIEFRSIS